MKVNSVLMRDLNDDEAPGLLAYCLEHGYELRFIEQMPLDAQHGWQRKEMVTAGEIFESLAAVFSFPRIPNGPVAPRPPRPSLSTAGQAGSG